MRLFLLLLIISTVAFSYPSANFGEYDDGDENDETDDDKMLRDSPSLTGEDEKMMKDEPTIDEREGPYVDFRDECTPRLDKGGCKCAFKDEYGAESIVEYDENDDCRGQAASDV